MMEVEQTGGKEADEASDRRPDEASNEGRHGAREGSDAAEVNDGSIPSSSGLPADDASSAHRESGRPSPSRAGPALPPLVIPSPSVPRLHHLPSSSPSTGPPSSSPFPVPDSSRVSSPDSSSDQTTSAGSSIRRTDLHLVRPTAAPWSFPFRPADAAGDDRRSTADQPVGLPDSFAWTGMAQAALVEEVEDVLEALSSPSTSSGSSALMDPILDGENLFDLPLEESGILPLEEPPLPSRTLPAAATAPPTPRPPPPSGAPRPTAPAWSMDRIIRPATDDDATLDVLQRLHPEDLRSLAEALRKARLGADARLLHDDRPSLASPHDPAEAPPFRLQDPPRGKRRKRAIDGAAEVEESGLGRQRRRVALEDSRRGMSRLRRQATQGDGSGPSAQGYPACTDVSNAVLSCYPTAGANLVQGVWSKMIWNNNYPTFIGSSYVDIYLFNADSEQAVANWTHIENNRGMIGILPQDTWLPNETSWTEGRNLSIPYYFVITDSGSRLTGAEQHQATFTVVQTAAPSTLIAASLSSAASVAGASSAASLASALSSFSSAESSMRSVQSAAGGSGTGGATAAGGSGSGNPSSLQGDGSGSSFPHWAIAVIVVLGFLALLALLVALYFVLVSARRKRELRSWSEGSRSPMMRSRNGENAALVGGSIGGSRRPESGSTGHLQDMHSPISSRPGSPLSHADVGATAGGGAALGAVAAAASSKRNSDHTADSRDGPITSDDALRMADAFRNALRKPEFPPSSGDPTPESSNGAEGALAGIPAGMRQSMQAQLCDAGEKSSSEPSPRLESSEEESPADHEAEEQLSERR